MSQRGSGGGSGGGGGGSDSDKLTASHLSSSRGPTSGLHHMDHLRVGRSDHLSGGLGGLGGGGGGGLGIGIDDDDKLLDVVGPPQSPLLSLGHSMQHLQHAAHPHSGKLAAYLMRAAALDVTDPGRVSLAAWFNLAGDPQAAEEAMRRRLQPDESERDGSDSSCSESVGGSTGGAFRPTSGSPKDGTVGPASYPSPNISVGPPIHPPPHLLPYLYPPGLYPPPPLSLLHNPAAAMNPGLNPGLLFNAQLALAAQHPALFGHYSGHAPSSPLQGMKGHRFSPYSLPGLGSAFDAVTPGSNSGGPRSLSSSPRPRATSNSPPNRPSSVSPAPPAAPKHSPHTPTAIQCQTGLTGVQPTSSSSSSPSELKSIEKMVNGLEAIQQNGLTVTDDAASKHGTGVDQ